MQVTESKILAAVSGIYLAGLRLVEKQPDVRFQWKLKEDGTFITHLDLETQRSLQDHLSDVFPNYRFIGEEDVPGERSLGLISEHQPRIILDPIDGTAAYARGLNLFAISLAVIDAENRPLLAIIHLPAMGRWCAASFEGSSSRRYEVSIRDDGPRIQLVDRVVAQPAQWRLEDSYVYVSSNTHRILDLSAYQGKCRSFGATAAHLALLLEGTIDPAAVVITRYAVWDVAAGLALAEAWGFEIRDLGAGEMVTTTDILSGGSKTPALIVGCPGVLSALRSQVRILERS
jgi:fructose-1,6-bisphosphatase/inositol monophosphatase family enzyme